MSPFLRAVDRGDGVDPSQAEAVGVPPPTGLASGEHRGLNCHMRNRPRSVVWGLACLLCSGLILAQEKEGRPDSRDLVAQWMKHKEKVRRMLPTHPAAFQLPGDGFRLHIQGSVRISALMQKHGEFLTKLIRSRRQMESIATPRAGSMA